MNFLRLRAIASAAAPAAVLASLLALAPGCGDDDSKNPAGPGNPSATTVLTGAFVGGSQGGLVSLSLSTADLAPRPPRGARGSPARADSVVSAVMTLGPVGGGAVNLTGTYDTQADSLHASGQGYQVSGRGDTTGVVAVVAGNYTSAVDSGAFVCTPGGLGSVKVFCGEFQSATGPATGRLNLVVSGGTLLGLFAYEGLLPALAFSGTVGGSGIVRSISFSGGASGTGSWNTATNVVSGAWSQGSDMGSWAGELCLPPDDE